MGSQPIIEAMHFLLGELFPSLCLMVYRARPDVLVKYVPDFEFFATAPQAGGAPAMPLALPAPAAVPQPAAVQAVPQLPTGAASSSGLPPPPPPPAQPRTGPLAPAGATAPQGGVAFLPAGPPPTPSQPPAATYGGVQHPPPVPQPAPQPRQLPGTVPAPPAKVLAPAGPAGTAATQQAGGQRDGHPWPAGGLGAAGLTPPAPAGQQPAAMANQRGQGGHDADWAWYQQWTAEQWASYDNRWTREEWQWFLR